MNEHVFTWLVNNIKPELLDILERQSKRHGNTLLLTEYLKEYLNYTLSMEYQNALNSIKLIPDEYLSLERTINISMNRK